MADCIVRTRVAFSRMGYGRSRGYDLVEQGLITKPFPLGGGRATGLLESEINAIAKARAAGVSNDEIRALVCALHAARRGTN